MKNTVKETQSVVDVFVSDGKHKGVSCPVEHEGETNIRKENEVIFRLREDPKYQISALAIWSENAREEIIDPIHIYYRHISTGRLCQSVYACLAGVEHDQYAEEKWDTLYYRISTMLVSDLRRIVYGEKKYAVHAL